MKTLPNIWINGIPNFDGVIDQIELCLEVLKDNAETADFASLEVKTRYFNDIIYMKQFFERAEVLARNNQ